MPTEVTEPVRIDHKVSGFGILGRQNHAASVGWAKEQRRQLQAAANLAKWPCELIPAAASAGRATRPIGPRVWHA